MSSSCTYPERGCSDTPHILIILFYITNMKNSLLKSREMMQQETQDRLYIGAQSSMAIPTHPIHIVSS